MVPPSSSAGIYGFVVGLDVNFDGWVDTSTNDESSEIVYTTSGTWETRFAHSGPARHRLPGRRARFYSGP